MTTRQNGLKNILHFVGAATNRNGRTLNLQCTDWPGFPGIVSVKFMCLSPVV
jgi:hypothetical protein